MISDDKTPPNVQRLAERINREHEPGELPVNLVQGLRKAVTSLHIKLEDVAFSKIIGLNHSLVYNHG